MNKLNPIAFFVAMSMISLVCGIQVWRWLSPARNVTTVSDELAGHISEPEEPEEPDQERVRNASKVIVEQVARLNKMMETPSDTPQVRQLQDFCRSVLEQVNEKVALMNKFTAGPLGREEREQVRQIWIEIRTKLATMEHAVGEMTDEMERSLRKLKRQ